MDTVLRAPLRVRELVESPAQRIGSPAASRTPARVVTLDWMRFEQSIGFRPNGVVLVFGQTAMFFYLAHRLAFEIPAMYFGLRGAGTIETTYIVAGVALVALYPACRWYRTFKAAHPNSVLKYL